MPVEAYSAEEGRIKDFKNKSLDAVELRRRRRDSNVELRKTQRSEHLMKKRNLDAEESESEAEQENLGQLPDIVKRINSSNPEVRLAATKECRKLLSKEKGPPIDDVISSGVLPHLVSFLQCHDQPDLQFEAAWTITNIASGTSEHTYEVCNSGACQWLITLMDSPNPDVRDQVVWALGNIAGDSADCRDYILQLGAVPALLRLLQSQPTVAHLRNAVWTLSNLCRGKNPQPDWNTVKHFIPALAHIIRTSDEDTITDTCWALSYLTDGDDSKIKEVVQSGVVPRLVELLMHHNNNLVIPALRTIGNICTGGEDTLTQSVIDAGALEPLRNLLTASKENIKKEACWTISNITAGSPSQIRAAIEANVVPPLIEIMRVGTYKPQKEATWALSNITTGGDARSISYIVQRGCIGPFCNLLGVSEVNLIKVVLDALYNMLKVGQSEAKRTGGVNQIANFIEDAGGVEKIDALQQHNNSEIYQKAYKLIDTYFRDESDEEVAELQPEVSAAGTFTFSTAAAQPQTFSF
eukprot:Colp12_sorted_trinity150504_noHs@5030